MASANLFQQYLQPARSVVDYQNDYAKADALKNQNAMQALTLQQASNVQQQRNALRDLVQSGQIDLNDPNGLQKAVTVAPDVAPALAKSIQDQKTSAALAAKDTAQAGNFTASTGKTNQETQIAAHQQHLQALSTVNTPEDAIAWMVQGVKDGTLPAQGLQPALQNLQANGVQGWKTQTLQSGQTVQQQLEMTAAKPTEVRLGNVVKTIDMNPRSQTFGQEVVGQQAIGQSPDSAAATGLGYSKLAEEKRHNGATETLESGKAATAAAGGGKLNEGQGKATTFAARMADAESTIQALESKGVSGTDMRTMAAGSNYTNWLASPEGQDYRQAQENWVTANLRQESGAAIGKDEMDKDVRKFFPAPGDADSVKAQKARARSVAQQGMLVQAGPGAAQVPGILQRAGVTPAAAAPAGVPDDIAAILAKHGGK